jgi:hypothetical protein
MSQTACENKEGENSEQMRKREVSSFENKIPYDEWNGKVGDSGQDIG